MTLSLVLAMWVLASVTLTSLWSCYRTFVATHSMDEFDEELHRHLELYRHLSHPESDVLRK